MNTLGAGVRLTVEILNGGSKRRELPRHFLGNDEFDFYFLVSHCLFGCLCRLSLANVRLEFCRPMAMARDLADGLLEKHAGIAAVVARQFVTAENDVVGCHAPCGAKKRMSRHATAFQSLAAICRTLDGGIWHSTEIMPAIFFSLMATVAAPSEKSR